MKTISLNGGWQVKPAGLDCAGATGMAALRAAAGEWMPARVPGEIHLDLMRAGRMDEPLFSANAPGCRWPEQHSWWYRKSFSVPETFLKHERLRLVCDGMDLYAQVFLNGVMAASAENAFVPAVFDAKPFLKAGRNDITIRMTCGTERSPEKPLIATKKKGNDDPYHAFADCYARRREATNIRGWLRKPQFSYGWDWVDSLPNIGIRGGVRLEGHSGVVIHDARLDTVMHGGAVFVRSEITIENLHMFEGRECVVELDISRPGGGMISRGYEIPLQVGRAPVRDFIEIPKALLWWPNGMGDQPLYKAAVRVKIGGKLCDRREFDMGLRTIEIDRSRLMEGRRFCVRVNGRDVFCKGANWVPADAIMARVDSRRYRRLIAEARDANFNMLRVWGGGIYEADEFYAACDRAGIMVWQDFMFACTEYPDDNPAFLNAVRAEAESAVMRLRHHACIALWCGNNENTSWASFGRSKRGFAIYNRLLPDVCRTLDPQRFYWPSSPSGGASPLAETDGDAHPWPYTMGPDCHIIPDDSDKLRCRFISEYGVIGPPVMDSIKDYLKPDEIKLDSRAWKIHTNEFENGLLANAIRHYYADPERIDLKNYLIYGAMFQTIQYGHYIDAARFRKLDPADDCQGFLFWMYADCWGEIGWTVIDYYLRRKPAFYAVKRAYRPLKVIVRPRGGRLVTRVVNDTLAPRAVEVRAGWRRLDGSDARVKRFRVRVPADGMAEILREPSAAPGGHDPRQWIYAAEMKTPGMESDTAVWTLLPYRRLELAQPEINVSVRGSRLELVSPVFCHGVHVEDHGKAALSDNYFDLLPGAPKRVERLDGKRGAPRFACVMPGKQ